jgi:hypothetical protein
MSTLEDLVSKVIQMAENSQKARGIDNFGSLGYKGNIEREYQAGRSDAADKLSIERDRQQGLMSNAREDREKAMTLANMQYGPGGSIDRGYRSSQDIANMGLAGHKYTADQNLAGHQLQADVANRGQDKTLEGMAMQYGPGGATDRRDALQFQKLTPEAQRAQHASEMAGRLAATGAPPEQVKALYESITSQPADFSELNPSRQTAVPASPYVFRDGSVEKTVTNQPLAAQQTIAPVQDNPPKVDKQPGFLDALKHSNDQLGGKLFDPLGLNKKKKSTNPLFQNYGY